MTDFETIRTEITGGVGIITLDRPDALNALNTQLMNEVLTVLETWESDPDIGAVVLTGSARAFAAGADIKEMQGKTFVEMYVADHFADWEKVAAFRKPTIAAVAGYALGGGCELALLCDILLAADTARFGQPEIQIGVIPGMGGSQRLTRAVGKAKAMDMVLTGRTMDAEEAERAGLVSRIVPAEQLLDTAVDIAATIVQRSNPAVQLAKECVNRASEMPLREGLLFEKRAFHALFATEDQKEGMAAFVEKRSPRFTNR